MRPSAISVHLLIKFLKVKEPILTHLFSITLSPPSENIRKSYGSLMFSVGTLGTNGLKKKRQTLRIYNTSYPELFDQNIEHTTLLVFELCITKVMLQRNM